MDVVDQVQPWRVMQEIDLLLMKAIPWSERLEQIGHSLLRLLQSDAIWLLTTPPISGIACGIIRALPTGDPNACVILTDMAPPPLLADPNSSLTKILQGGKPYLTNGTSLANGRLDNDLADTLLQTMEVKPSLIVPLLAGGQPVGALIVADRGSPSNRLPQEILQSIGEHLGVTLQSAYLRDSSRHQADALSTLNRIARTITSSLDIEEVIQRTMAGINEILDVEAGSLLLVDERNNELYFKITLRGENKKVTEFRLDMGQGIAGWVVEHCQPAIVNNVDTDPRFFSKIDEAIGFKTKAVMCAPLIVQGQPIGALEVINKRRGQFSLDDQELLTSMCASLSVALNNAQLYEEAQRQTQRAAIINKMATAINASRSLPEASRTIAVQLRRLIDFDYASLCLLDDNARYLQVYDLSEPSGRLQRGATLPFEGSGLEWIIHRPETRLVKFEYDNLEHPPGLPDTDAAFQEMISIPLVVQKKVSGVINLASTTPDVYTAADLDILEQIAPQLAVAIEKARLFDLMERRTAELQTLNRLGERLAATVDSERILTTILALMPHLVPGEVQALLLLDEDGGRWGIKMPFTPDEAFLNSILEEMTNTLSPLIDANDLQIARRKVFAEQRPMPDDWEAVATLTLPILTRLGPVGVAHLASSTTEEFADEALRLFSLVVSQIATTIENARLFREVEKERARLVTFLSSTAELIIVVDREDCIVLANPAAQTEFGPDKRWENRPFSEVIENEALIELFSDSKRHKPTSNELQLPDGRTLHVNLSPIAGNDDKVSGWVTTMHDVTHLKELDQLKTDFINAVTHDMRSPLSGILIATHLVSQAGEVNEKQLEFLNTIENRVAAMSELIDDLLDVARIEAGIDMEMEPCVVSPLITQVVNQFQEQIENKKLRVQLQLAGNIPPVMGNEARLRQALLNLIGNSIKYTPEGGKIIVEASHNYDNIVVSVEDTGPGISLNDQPYIFDKFYRVDRPGAAQVKGTGLGLAITRSIIEKHNGLLWVDSQLNRGSTFSFVLPIIKEEPEAG